MMTKKKYVYAFKEGNKDMRNLLGGKGANLAEMTGIGLPVPRGFTVTTEACIKYYDDGEDISKYNENKSESKLWRMEKTSFRTKNNAAGIKGIFTYFII